MIRWLVHVAAATAILATPNQAVPAAQDALAPMLACAAERDPAARLACFDAAVAGLRQAGAPAVEAPAGGRAVVAEAAPPRAAPTPPVPAVSAPAAAVAAPAAAVPAASTAAALTPEEKFGLRGDQRQEKLGEVTEISATATLVQAKPHGELVVTLDNGQVWAEIASGSKIRLKAGDPVKIEAGVMGSFILVAPNGRSSRVSRVR